MGSAIKAVVFDLDDTLYSYESLHKQAMEKVLLEGSKELYVSREELLSAFEQARAKTKEELQETAAAHNRILYFQKTLELLHRNPIFHALELYDIYWGYMLKNMKANEGVYDILEYCRKKGLRIGICTDLTAQIQHRKLRKLGIAKYVDAIVSSEEAGCEKPNPKIFSMILDKMGVLPSEIIYIGDSLKKDIQGAKDAGMNAIWFTEESVGDIISIQNMIELKRFLD